MRALLRLPRGCAKFPRGVSIIPEPAAVANGNEAINRGCEHSGRIKIPAIVICVSCVCEKFAVVKVRDSLLKREKEKAGSGSSEERRRRAGGQISRRSINYRFLSVSLSSFLLVFCLARGRK